jgi:hypothetical protein
MAYSIFNSFDSAYSGIEALYPKVAYVFTDFPECIPGIQNVHQTLFDFGCFVASGRSKKTNSPSIEKVLYEFAIDISDLGIGAVAPWFRKLDSLLNSTKCNIIPNDCFLFYHGFAVRIMKGYVDPNGSFWSDKMRMFERDKNSLNLALFFVDLVHQHKVMPMKVNEITTATTLNFVKESGVRFCSGTDLSSDATLKTYVKAGGICRFCQYVAKDANSILKVYDQLVYGTFLTHESNDVKVPFILYSILSTTPSIYGRSIITVAEKVEYSSDYDNFFTQTQSQTHQSSVTVQSSDASDVSYNRLISVPQVVPVIGIVPVKEAAAAAPVPQVLEVPPVAGIVPVKEAAAAAPEPVPQVLEVPPVAGIVPVKEADAAAAATAPVPQVVEVFPVAGILPVKEAAAAAATAPVPQVVNVPPAAEVTPRRSKRTYESAGTPTIVVAKRGRRK